MYQSGRRWRIRLGSVIFCGWLLIAGALRPTSLNGETLIPESVADGAAGSGVQGLRGQEAKLPGTFFVGFRTWNLAKWKVDSATLFDHLAGGEAPASVEISVRAGVWSETVPPTAEASKLKFVLHNVQKEPKEWLAVAVDRKLVEELIASKSNWLAVRGKSATVVQTRETRSYVPYLIVMGGRG